MRTLPATVAVFAATTVLMGGCGDNPSGSGTGGAGEAGPSAPGRARPVIVPEEDLVSSEDSGDLPEATAQVALDCQKMSKNHDFAGTAQTMDDVASSSGSSPSAKALAKVCLSAAKANQGLWQDALDEAGEAEKLTGTKEFADEVPSSTRRRTLRMLNRTKMYSALAVGDADSAREARAALERLGGVSPQDLRNTCSVASDPALLPDCATIGPSSPTGEPPSGEQPSTNEESSPGEPTIPSEEPAESGTGTTDGPAETGGPVEPTDEGDSTPDNDDGPAPAES